MVPLAAESLGLFDRLAGGLAVDRSADRPGGRERRLRALSQGVEGGFLAGGHLCLVLSADGRYVVWQGFGLPAVMCWLPWVLLAVDQAVRRPAGWGGPCLAVLTFVVLVGGTPGIAGQMLIASGLYALWCYVDQYRTAWFTWRSLQSLALLALAWILGILASAWLLLPAVEYARTGTRVLARSHGVEERPPVGLAALPQVVLPEMYGATQEGSFRIVGGNVPESSVGAYAGLLATLFVAPLAWCSRRHWSINMFWMFLGFVALSWSLDIPGIVALLRMPGLNMLSNNRFVFVTAFAILALAAVGLEAIFQGNVSRRWWFVLPAILLAVLCIWCVYRSFILPEPVATQLGAASADR